MPARNMDLHGMVPDKSNVALVLLDVINDLEFEGSEALQRYVPRMTERLVEFKRRVEAAEIPVIYVNDNFGRWRSDFRRLIDHCVNTPCPGREMSRALAPAPDDYFVLKPKHSGFFSTTLDTLLNYLQVRTLIVAGVAGNICVLFTANDAYMRDFRLVVPSDCVASNTEEENRYALEQMRDVLKADITPSTELDLEALKRHTPPRDEPEMEPSSEAALAGREGEA